MLSCPIMNFVTLP